MTKPSRSLSNGREACLGSSLRVLMARMAQKPPMPMGTMVASAPPANITLRIAHFDGAPGFADGVVGGGAGGAGGEIRAAQIVIHREQAGSHVRDEHRDHERREPARAAFEQDLVLLARSVCSPPMPEPMNTPISSRFVLVEVEAGIQQRLASRRKRRIAKSGPCAGFPWATETRARDRNPSLRAAICVVERRRVKGGDPVDAALAGDQVVPESVHVAVRAA